MRVLLMLFILCASLSARAQEPQLPSLQTCNSTQVIGDAKVHIASRSATGVTGTFAVTTQGVKCEPAAGYPAGSVRIVVDLTDSTRGTITSTSLEQVTSTGKQSPTAYVSGRCTASPTAISGCRFWLMIADNGSLISRGTPDVLGFLVIDGRGTRIAYGTGPIREGDFRVASTAN
jgi:hypothetical protein